MYTFILSTYILVHLLYVCFSYIIKHVWTILNITLKLVFNSELTKHYFLWESLQVILIYYYSLDIASALHWEFQGTFKIIVTMLVYAALQTIWH